MIGWICFAFAIWIFTCVMGFRARDKERRKANPLEIADDVDIQFDKTLISRYLEHGHLNSELEKDIFDSVNKLDAVEIKRQKTYLLEWKMRFDVGTSLSNKTYKLSQIMVLLSAMTLIYTFQGLLEETISKWFAQATLGLIGLTIILIEVLLICLEKNNAVRYSRITAFINIYESYIDDRLINLKHSDD